VPKIRSRKNAACVKIGPAFFSKRGVLWRALVSPRVSPGIRVRNAAPSLFREHGEHSLRIFEPERDPSHRRRCREFLYVFWIHRVALERAQFLLLLKVARRWVNELPCQAARPTRSGRCSIAWNATCTRNGSLAVDLKIVALTMVRGFGGRGRISGLGRVRSFVASFLRMTLLWDLPGLGGRFARVAYFSFGMLQILVYSCHGNQATSVPRKFA